MTPEFEAEIRALLDSLEVKYGPTSSGSLWRRGLAALLSEVERLRADDRNYLFRVVALARAERSLPTESVIFQASLPDREIDFDAAHREEVTGTTDAAARSVTALVCFDFVEFDGRSGHVIVIDRMPGYERIEFAIGENDGHVQWEAERVEVRGAALSRVHVVKPGWLAQQRAGGR